MANGGLLIPTANRSAYITGTKNNFSGAYSNQCTWWASQRYHDLTGIWLPWSGNAKEWVTGAANARWQVQSQPPKGIPSIICLQGYAGQGLLGAGLAYGHVGIVESINSDGSVQTSNFNWYPHLGDSQVAYVRFVPGNGVSFLYASNSAVASGAGTSLTSLAATFVQKVQLTPNESVTQFLYDIDQSLQFTNPFIPLDAASLLNPVDYIEAVAANLWQDTAALIWRIVFLLLGFFLLYKVLSHFIDFAGIASDTAGTVAQIMPYLA